MATSLSLSYPYQYTGPSREFPETPLRPTETVESGETDAEKPLEIYQ